MDEIDRILSSEESITPSSGFTSSVMEAIRTADAAPAPLPFPWGRFVIGLAACAVWALSAIALVQQVDFSVLAEPVARLAAVAPQLGWAAAVAIISVGVLHVQQFLVAR